MSNARRRKLIKAGLIEDPEEMRGGYCREHPTTRLLPNLETSGECPRCARLGTAAKSSPADEARR